MRRWQTIPAVVVAMVLVLAACGKSDKTTASDSTTTVAPANSTTTAAAATGGSTLAAANNAKLGKLIVVNSSGNTVYMFVPDGDSKTSKVPDAVKPNWPAVKGGASAPTVGADLDQSKIAVNMQADGTDQVSYGGHLLYTFVGDKAPGDVSGEGLGGNWYAVNPSGEKV